MKILHVYPRLLRGGVEKVIENIIRFSDPELCSYEILTQEEGNNEATFRQLGIKIRCIPYSGDDAAYRRDLHRLFAAEKYDAVHCHGHREMSLVNIEARQAGVPVRIAHCHSAHQDVSGPKKWFRILKFRRHARGATDLIGCSKDALNWMFPFAGARGQIITNGIDCSRFAFSASTRTEVRKEAGIPDSASVVITVARVSPEKNHRLIIEMARRSSHVPDRLFVVVGDGPLLPSLRKEVARLGLKNILFPGACPDPERWLCAADIFIFPSSFEGHPLAPMEAQISGLPVVVSRAIPSETEMKSGLLFRVGSLDADDWLAEIMKIEASLNHSVESRYQRSRDALNLNTDKDVTATTRRFFELYSPPRILFCHVTSPKGVTGGERYDALFARSMKHHAEGRIGEYIIAPKESCPPSGKNISAKMSLPFATLLRNLTKAFRPLKAHKDIRNLLRRYRRIGAKPPVMIFNTSKCLYFLPALRILRRSGVVTAGITHHPLFIQMKGFRRIAYKAAELAFIRRLDFCIAPSQFTRDLLMKNIPGREVTLIPIPFEKRHFGEVKRLNPNFFIENDINSAINRDLIAEEWKKIGKFAKEKTELLFIATIEPRKGLDYLLSAMTILNRNNVRTRLTVAGKVIDEAYALKLRSEALSAGLDVDWLGYVDEERKMSLFREADIFVLPSEAEGFGIVLVEAMMAATPVVSFRNSGMIYVIGPDDDRGLTATDGNPEDLAEAITRFIKDPDLRYEKVSAALDWTQSLPSPIDFDRDIKILCGHILQ